MKDQATRWRAGRPGHGREPRTRPVRVVDLDCREGHYPEVHVDEDPDVDAAVERRVQRAQLIAAAQDDEWEDQ